MKASLALASLKKKYNVKLLKTKVENRKQCLGICFPNLKLFANEIYKDNPTEFLDSNDLSLYELEILHTYVIGKLKDFKIAFKYFKEYAPKAKEWSTVDSLCQKFVITKKHRDEVLPLLLTYSKSKDEYLQRIVAVMLLSHYLEDEYLETVFNLLGKLNHEGYFTKMGVAWAFATVMTYYPRKCLEYLKESKLDKWTHNKAIQKMKESFRISDDYKQKLERLKK
jgi:3-methyladenine DNA glycosylase AlkD